LELGAVCRLRDEDVDVNVRVLSFVFILDIVRSSPKGSIADDMLCQTGILVFVFKTLFVSPSHQATDWVGCRKLCKSNDAPSCTNTHMLCIRQVK
jgi:hypothetical protein